MISGLTNTIKAQVSCDLMNLVVNVSDTGLVKLYHPGHYLTHPQSENVIIWEITDSQGNIIAGDTLMNNSDFLFYHNIPLTDTMNVSSLLTNDSAGIACLIEDKLFWEVTEIIPGVFIARWEFVFGNVGVDVTNTVGIEDIKPASASIFPNPSSDEINIVLDKGQLLKIELFDMAGRLLFKKDLNSRSYSLNIRDFSSGVYWVRIFNQDNNVVSAKFIKE